MVTVLETRKRITESQRIMFSVSQSGLVALFVTARCGSKNQSDSGSDEDLRFEFNGLRFREVPPQRNIQVFNVPPACNGAKLKGRAQTIVFFTTLQKGTHTIGLIPKSRASIDIVRIQELAGQQHVVLNIEEQAEDGDRRPWYSFVLLDLPLKTFVVDATIERRVRDSDDIQIVVDGRVIPNPNAGKFPLRNFVGSFLKWLVRGTRGERRRTVVPFIGIGYGCALH